MQPLVSIVIPAYNAEKNIEICIKSIQNQTYKNLEIICVNDGSKDATADILDKIAKTDARLKVIHNENQGVSATRNCGIQNANGKYIQFVDSDDMLYQHTTETMVNIMEDKLVDWVICGYHRTDGCDIHVPIVGMYSVEEMVRNFAEVYRGGVFNQPWNKLYRKDNITSCFNREMSIAEDAVFNLDYMNNISHIYFVDEIGYHYVIDNPNSLSWRYNSKAFESEKKKIEAIKEVTTQFGSNEVALNLYKDFEQDFVRCVMSLIYSSNKSCKEIKESIYAWVNDSVWREVLLFNRNINSFNDKKVVNKISVLVTDRTIRKKILQVIKRFRGQNDK